MRDIVVLGAGVIGVTSAYMLWKEGYNVILIDKNSEPALETSYANGCQISVSHAEPWANPGAPLKILKWLFKKDSPLYFQPQFDIEQWKWILNFFRNCTPGKTRENTQKIVELGLRSRTLIKETAEELGIEFDQKYNGILHYYTDLKEYESGLEMANFMSELGCDRKPVQPPFVEIGKHLDKLNWDGIIGGTFTENDFSGDVRKFTVSLFDYLSKQTRFSFEQRPVSYNLFETPGLPKADYYVFCLGPENRFQTMEPTGIYPSKGYSITAPFKTQEVPTTSMTDDENKLVYSNLTTHLRVAGTAELRTDRTLQKHRLIPIIERAKERYGDLVDWDNTEGWCALRPTTPSNVPVIKQSTKYSNVIINAGHGTLGWTMSMGSAERIKNIIIEQTKKNRN